MIKLSVVTPSYNQADYLISNLMSVSSSGHNVEHIVIDGGSTDGTVRLLEDFSENLAYWISEKDDGQYDAINKGFKQSRGEILAWLNADDMYFPWTVSTVLDIFETFPEIEWLTTLHPTAINSRGHMIKLNSTHGFDRLSFLSGLNLTGAEWEADLYIQQESTFWRRSLWERAGGYVDQNYRFAGDFELWTRFFQHARLYAMDVPLGTFRKHAQQKTSIAPKAYVEEAKNCLIKYGGSIPTREQAEWFRGARRNGEMKSKIIEQGLAEWAPILTYNWWQDRWEIIEN